MQLLQKLKQLEENIKLLGTLKELFTLEEVKQNRRYEWELRYGLFESIQILIDISCKIVNRYNLGNPQNYRECLELLERNGYIDNASHFSSMIGLRNLLIHEYAQIDTEKLYGFLEMLDDFDDFVRQIAEHL